MPSAMLHGARLSDAMQLLRNADTEICRQRDVIRELHNQVMSLQRRVDTDRQERADAAEAQLRAIQGVLGCDYCEGCE